MLKVKGDEWEGHRKPQVMWKGGETERTGH